MPQKLFSFVSSYRRTSRPPLWQPKSRTFALAEILHLRVSYQPRQVRLYLFRRAAVTWQQPGDAERSPQSQTSQGLSCVKFSRLAPPQKNLPRACPRLPAGGRHEAPPCQPILTRSCAMRNAASAAVGHSTLCAPMPRPDGSHRRGVARAGRAYLCAQNWANLRGRRLGMWGVRGAGCSAARVAVGQGTCSTGLTQRGC